MRHFSGEFSGVRLLMADELDQISGGDGEDTDDVGTGGGGGGGDIVVVGSPSYSYNQETFGWDTSLWYNWDQWFGQNNWTTPAAYTAPNTGEAAIDSMASTAKSLILSQPNNANQEFGYFIIEDANGVRLSQALTTGEDWRINFQQLFPEGFDPTDIGAANWGQVKGFVHNHPHSEDLSIIPGDPNALNRMPSPSDWDMATQISSLSGATSGEFRNYIIDEHGTMRQYDVNDSRSRVSADVVG